MKLPKVIADFQNADSQGRLRLNCVGTIQDLVRQGIQLHEGLELILYDLDVDDAGRPCELQAQGVVAPAPEDLCWVAAIDWTNLRRVPIQEIAVK